MLKKILIGLGAVIALLVLVIALQPATFRIERSVTIAAPAAAAHAQVNDFHPWSDWSPWEKLDPNLKRSYEGPTSGAGAKYAWVGNDDVGEGRMTIEKSTPERIEIKLEFLKPFEATNTTIFAFSQAGEGSKVTWSMEGTKNFMSKAFSLVMNMDELVGKDFEKGLAALKVAAEATPKARSVANAAP